jgi:integrase
MCSPENTQTGARAYEAQLRHKLAIGEPIIEVKETKVQAPTFKEFSSQWMEIYVKNNNKYSEVINKESILRAHLLLFFGHKQIDQISNLDIENFKAQKLKKGLANKSINNFLIVLSKCLKMAKEWEIIQNIPRIKLLKVQPQKFDFLTKEESQLLLDNSDGLMKDMIQVALKTGLRFGELIALDWSDVDFKNNLITVRNSISMGRLGGTKNNKIRYIPLLDEVSRLLFAKSKKNGFVFSKNNNEPFGPVQCLRWLHRVCKKAGMRKIGWHTLRHTFASHLAQNGVSIMLIKELLGHSDIRTSLRYSHLTPLATREAIKVLEWESGDIVETIPAAEEHSLVPAKAEISMKPNKKWTFSPYLSL